MMEKKNTPYKQLIKDAIDFDIPLVVQFELTYECNLKCIHCIYYKGNRFYKTDTSELSYNDIKKIVEQLYKLKTFF